MAKKINRIDSSNQPVPLQQLWRPGKSRTEEELNALASDMGLTPDDIVGPEFIKVLDSWEWVKARTGDYLFDTHSWSKGPTFDRTFFWHFERLPEPTRIAFLEKYCDKKMLDQLVKRITEEAMGAGADVTDIIGADKFFQMFVDKFAAEDKKDDDGSV